ncbi:DUF2238 domain-containing protein [Paenibacillus qinlingensis]|uniref:Membrane protein n=1 Tax=Paenibacillus qinlingensis TaxID=1837343 RepID=A0ABU1P700_9BACL|nr:DUF2238 domain-containing protein [Paenibacillus qinlingensis]MDR6555525.1 putative membrane protein [Paenibacillus qinlingensis]
MQSKASKKAFRTNWMLHGMMVIWLGAWGWLAISPHSRGDWVLENLLIWAALIGLVATYRWFVFSNLTYGLLASFLLLHSIGAHFSYNGTWFDPWLRGLFGSERDHFDRLVHLCFGLLCAYPIYEGMAAWTKLGRRWIYVMTCVIVLAMGAFYELIEMWVANIVALEIGTLFVGAQGDPWDAQHDMELALYGAIIGMLVTAWSKRWKATTNSSDIGEAKL